jgi:hypothetical protein
VYEVEYAPGVERDIEDLPAPARRACRAAIEMIRRDPWRGEQYSGHPREFRTWTFDHWGLIVYLIRERVVRVVLLQVTWAG